MNTLAFTAMAIACAMNIESWSFGDCIVLRTKVPEIVEADKLAGGTQQSHCHSIVAGFALQLERRGVRNYQIVETNCKWAKTTAG